MTSLICGLTVSTELIFNWKQTLNLSTLLLWSKEVESTTFPCGRNKSVHVAPICTRVNVLFTADCSSTLNTEFNNVSVRSDQRSALCSVLRETRDRFLLMAASPTGRRRPEHDVIHLVRLSMSQIHEEHEEVNVLLFLCFLCKSFFEISPKKRYRDERDWENKK